MNNNTEKIIKNKSRVTAFDLRIARLEPSSTPPFYSSTEEEDADRRKATFNRLEQNALYEGYFSADKKQFDDMLTEHSFINHNLPHIKYGGALCYSKSFSYSNRLDDALILYQVLYEAVSPPPGLMDLIDRKPQLKIGYRGASSEIIEIKDKKINRYKSDVVVVPVKSHITLQPAHMLQEFQARGMHEIPDGSSGLYLGQIFEHWLGYSLHPIEMTFETDLLPGVIVQTYDVPARYKQAGYGCHMLNCFLQNCCDPILTWKEKDLRKARLLKELKELREIIQIMDVMDELDDMDDEDDDDNIFGGNSLLYDAERQAFINELATQFPDA